MTGVWRQVRRSIERHGSVALVSVIGTAGSAPCEPGARLIAQVDGFVGTIGGGRLEYEALADAQAMLSRGDRGARIRDWPLGPALGQCCGGMVRTLTEIFAADDLPTVKMLEQAESAGPFDTVGVLEPNGRIVRRIATEALSPSTSGCLRPHGAPLWERFGEKRTPVLLFGAGHVGRALVLALAPLPFGVRWIDSRPGQFPRLSPENVSLIQSTSPETEIGGAPSGAFVVIFTHSHALDFAIAAEALRRSDLEFVGLIGSTLKRERFTRVARQMGLVEADIARLVCPIGIPEIVGKEPAVIAASCAAQLIIRRQRAPGRNGTVRRP